jgi:hypothetical protein
MNFSEYIAILSGDTSLLEKSRLEKKIAVLESLRVAHHKEIVRSKFQLDMHVSDKANDEKILNKLSIDEVIYKEKLRYDKDGAKLNPIQIHNCNSAVAETIGKYLIKLNNDWKPKANESDDLKIGELYGFDLFIRRQKEAYENKSMFEYHYHNTFYAEGKESGIKYFYNQGYINTDNPKLAARYFLNAIDRIDPLKEKYQKTITEHDGNIQMLKQIIAKPFEKDNELSQLKQDVSKLEREISIKIQTNQMKQHEGIIPVAEKKEALVVELKDDKNLVKKVCQKRTKGLKI